MVIVVLLFSVMLRGLNMVSVLTDEEKHTALVKFDDKEWANLVITAEVLSQTITETIKGYMVLVMRGINLEQ